MSGILVGLDDFDMGSEWSYIPGVLKRTPDTSLLLLAVAAIVLCSGCGTAAAPVAPSTARSEPSNTLPAAVVPPEGMVRDDASWIVDGTITYPNKRFWTPGTIPEPRVRRGAGEGPAAKVLSYLNRPTSGRPNQDWLLWRLYDPGTGKDTILMRFGEAPGNVAWDPAFTQVTFTQKRTLFRLEWKVNALPEVLFRLPKGAGEPGNIWLDDESHLWRFNEDVTEGSGDEEPRSRAVEGGEGGNGKESDGGGKRITRVWERAEPEGTWSIIASRPVECACDDCVCFGDIHDLYHPQPTVKILHLLRSMVLEERLSPGGRNPCKEKNGSDEGICLFPSSAVPKRTLKIRFEIGDSGLLVPPASLINEETGHETVLWAATKHDTSTEGTDESSCLGELGFAEEGAFLLLETAADGHCPKVFDYRTGELLFEPIGETDQAVWVEPPKP